jgi:LysR family transcriptional activator of mexEF-oprN operon
MPRPQNVNLNLLAAFEALVTERNLVRAAAKAGVSQPALSYDLKKLRSLFNDELFVRGADGLELTARGRQLYEAFRPALAQLQSVVAGAAVFDPATATRRFNIAMTDSTTYEVVAPLVRRIRREAPAVQLRVENAGAEDACSLMVSGMVELALVTRVDIPPGIVRREVYRDHVVCVADRNHPELRNGKMSRAAMEKVPHVIVAADRRIRTHTGRFFRERGVRLNLAVILPHQRNVAEIVRGTDLVGFTRSGLVPPRGQERGLVFFPPPFDLPVVTFSQIWPERSNNEPGHVWLRDLMLSVIREEFPDKVSRS